MRIAIAVYVEPQVQGKAPIAQTVPEAIEWVCADIAAGCPPEVHQDSNGFRKLRCYNEHVDVELQKHAVRFSCGDVVSLVPQLMPSPLALFRMTPSVTFSFFMTCISSHPRAPPYSQASLRRIFAVYASANKDLDDQLQSSKFMSVGMPHIVHTHTPLCPKGRCAMHSPLTLHSVHPLSP